jgi:PleD family two-component response regulator
MIHQAICAQQIPHSGSKVAGYASLSLDVATYNGLFRQSAEITKAVTAARHKAKEQGRNRMEAVSGLSS